MEDIGKWLDRSRNESSGCNHNPQQWQKKSLSSTPTWNYSDF